MTASSLYQEIVLEHSRAPRNFGGLEAHTHAADGDNPLCGDALRFELRVIDERIAEIRFRGEGCAIARATASMLSERVAGLGAAETAILETSFARVVSGEIDSDATLGDLNALAALAKYPTRRKCALLPFATLRAALAGAAKTTTEGSSA
jgi:nitrogen fixation NifU-like protein